MVGIKYIFKQIKMPLLAKTGRVWIKYIFKQIKIPLLAKTRRVYFVGKYFELKSGSKVKVYLQNQTSSSRYFWYERQNFI